MSTWGRQTNQLDSRQAQYASYTPNALDPVRIAAKMMVRDRAESKHLSRGLLAVIRTGL